MADKKRLAWFIFIRVMVVTVFLVSTYILYLKEPDSIGQTSLATLTKLIVATYLFSFVSFIVLKISTAYQRFLTYIQIIWDLILVTLLLVITGGINSPYSFLYTMSIISASVLLARREAIYTASLCAILYGAILDFQYYGKLTALGLSQVPAQQYGASYVFYTLFLNIGAFYLTAFLTGYLAERARKSETALREKVIDLEELERLNSSIVANLGSGLLTINNSGRVRVFNRYAQQITNMTQEDAYDKQLYEIFPGFEKYADSISEIVNGEIDYQTDHSTPLIIGFKSVPLTDKMGVRIGAIINLLDLTQIKMMETELKKADRLAAIGELSARIAHEIRNPLAAISGSVQLISQGRGISSEDSRLLAIVLRETSRLNELITDFLAYARPNLPEKIPIVLHGLVEEIESMAHADHRFAQVRIHNECPPSLMLMADLDQIRQVFWNLLVNAVEAMTDGGSIHIHAAQDFNDSLLPRKDSIAIVLADDGMGMDERVKSRIFEPFFTTKSAGTGLGLATVYRIIQAHGGMLHVDSTPGAGSRFTIVLPK
jgi:two-component system, NtrC family, sensor histidine kinase PilS